MSVQKEAATWEQRLDDATEKGREEGEKQAKIAVAKSLLKAGVSIDVISRTIGFSVDEIKQLQEEIV